ncbi:MAG: hypothetical protein HY902_00775 [Deltaproteobacteria bacterium]|nr:hypothetical protein [Deltaproteobacteria bacterium]
MLDLRKHLVPQPLTGPAQWPAARTVWSVAAVCLLIGCDTGTATNSSGGNGAGQDAVSDTATASDTAATGDAGDKLPTTVTVLSNAKPVESSWFIPMNAANNKIALFSEQREPFTVNNMTGKTVTVKDVTLTPAADSPAEEWSLQKYDIKAKPIDAAGATIATGKSYDFYVRFYPVLGAERKATLKVETDAGTFEIALSGRGAPDSTWPVGATVEPDQALGTPDKDELVGTMVADSAGNQYVSANVDFSIDEGVLVTKVGADGKLLWSKFWNGQYKDRARDPGQNAESGGSAGSLSLDAAGNLYAIASISRSSANSAFNGGITKIGADGTPAWSKLFGYGKLDKASQSAEFYAVDASGPVVYAAGTCGDPTNAIGGEGLALFVALDPADGSVKAKKGFDFTPTYNDRIYAVRGDGKGSAWIGGVSGSGAYIAKIKNADSAPEIEWVKTVGLGKGGNVNSLDLDGAGNLYAGLDVRGSLTALAFGKFGPDGSALWTKQVLSGSGDKNNVHVARFIGGKLWVGGRIFIDGFDGQMGDGWLGRVSPDGALEWSAFHFSGKGPDEMAEHRVKGIAVTGDKVRAVSQVYTGTMNGVRYAGYWYNGSAGIDKLDVAVDALKDGTAKNYPLAGSDVSDASTLVTWKDPPKTVPLQASLAKHDGTPPDSDLMLSAMTVK